MIDALTGLLDRNAFHQQARQAVHSVDNGLAVVWFNLDNFKMFNNRFGFEKGDEILKEIAVILRSIFSPDDYKYNLLARFSDDNFVALTDWLTVEVKIDTVQEYLYTLHDNVTLRLRAGIYFPSDNEDIRISCDRAKIACDNIKKNHSVSACMFHDGMSRELHMQQYILDNFDSAIEFHKIGILYQPIVNLATGKICEVEALARWNSHDRGTIPPGEFIPTLEEYHEIHKLDIFAIKRVCRDCRERAEKSLPMLPVSINLSRLDFELCDIIGEIERSVTANNIQRDMINIEITESVNSEDMTVLNLGMEKLRALGYEIWMDDFGSGYSSLNVLKDYSFDTIKFDMKFLHGFDINQSEKAKYIISANLSMARMMGMKALAEGVETAEQLEYLTSIGFDKAQGYYFGKPMELEEIFELSRGWQC
ncbi:MAG: bifunctional diguanylate cyclase/phosphodiesterase [Synergistaceae bacterium]|nr:bifunctional diguanylate cyclase/phosphodiesterase [Synergistaceae bacterium]